MKKFFFAVLALFFLCTAQALQAQTMYQLLKYPKMTIKGVWELSEHDNNVVQLNYYNNDRCPYLLYVIDNKKFYTVFPGKNTVYSKKRSAPDDPFSKNTYYFYRGKFPKNLNPAFVYAMPVAEGVEVEWMIDPRERMRSYFFKVNYADTVYAARSGMVCSSDFENGLLVYHRDDTFGAYLNLSQRFVDAGSIVKVGDPIGLAHMGGVSFSVFFLDENLFHADKPKSYPYSQITPYFRTDKGDVKLEKGVKYSAVKDDPLIMQEMSKSEQKRYLKNKKK